MNRLAAIKVFKSAFAPLFFDDGRPRLFQLVSGRLAADGQPYVLVHPERWDAFFMAVNQPDIFSHPEVQELLGLGRPR